MNGKVAATFCHGRPIAYAVKEEAGVTDDWIRTHAMPRTAEKYPKQVDTVLGRAVLWKVFRASVSEDREQHCIPAPLKRRVMRALRGLGERCNLVAGENPANRLPLGATGVDAQLVVDIIMTDDVIGSGNGERRVTGAPNR